MPLDYRRLAGISLDDEEDTNSPNAESRTSNSFLEETTLVYMVGTPKDFLRRTAEQDKVIHKNSRNPSTKSRRRCKSWSKARPRRRHRLPSIEEDLLLITLQRKILRTKEKNDQPPGAQEMKHMMTDIIVLIQQHDDRRSQNQKNQMLIGMLL